MLTLLAITLIAVGCSNDATMTGTASNAAASDGASSDGPNVSSPNPEIVDRTLDTGADPVPASASSSASESAVGMEIPLTPENTKIEFVGIHAGDKPDPRHGTFESFDGKAMIKGGRLASFDVTIETASLTTDIERLTNHLKSPDFFDVNEHPEATFRTTSIAYSGDGASNVSVTGDLTLHGVTKSISFPATVTTEDGLDFTAEFSIDRTEFGMNFSVERVVADVSLSVSIDG
jgi:polyisoprenoid-binding protein YceI